MGPSKQETTITQSNEAVGGWGPARWYNKHVDLQEVTEIACQRIARCLITQQALQTTDCPVHRSLEVIVSTRVCDHRSGQYFPQFLVAWQSKPILVAAEYGWPLWIKMANFWLLWSLLN